MLQCVLYIFLGGTLFISNGCIPYQGSIGIDRVEYVDSYAPSHHSYKRATRFPMGYTMHRSKMPMRYHADDYSWYYNQGIWYKRPYGIGTYYPRKRGIYRNPRTRHRAYRPVLPKKSFVKSKFKKKSKKKHKKRRRW